MFLDLHAHTKAISHCCRVSTDDVFRIANEKGYDGLVIANHYSKEYFSSQSYDSWIESYVEEWENCKRQAEKYGMISLNAIEVSMDYLSGLHLLIYGVDDKFIRENKRLNEMSLKDLYDLCKKNGCLLIQAHPFRNEVPIQDVRYLDGLEINSHPKYRHCYEKEIVDVANKNGLILTAGCDFHGDSERVLGGMFLPDDIKTEKNLTTFLIVTKEYNIKYYDATIDKQFEKTYKKR